MARWTFAGSLGVVGGTLIVSASAALGIRTGADIVLFSTREYGENEIVADHVSRGGIAAPSAKPASPPPAPPVAPHMAQSQAAAFVSKWTGSVISPESVIVTSNPPRDFTGGTIVIHFSEDDSRYGSPSTVGLVAFRARRLTPIEPEGAYPCAILQQ